jgi:RNA polymerase sigma-70 factor (ECF subfamily)
MQDCPHSQLAPVREPRFSPSTTVPAPSRGAPPPPRRAASTTPIGPQPRVLPLDRPAPRWPLDLESRSWLERLHAAEPTRASAVAELYERLRREAAFHIRHRVRNRTELHRGDIDDLATEAAGDALMSLLRKLDDFRGESRFWTWARRFAALEAPASIRRRVEPDRFGIAANPELALGVPDPACSAQELLETRELLQRVRYIVANQLTNRQRTILIATAVNGVSPQTLACQLHTTPGAIYKTLHDARRKLKANLAEA